MATDGRAPAPKSTTTLLSNIVFKGHIANGRSPLARRSNCGQHQAGNLSPVLYKQLADLGAHVIKIERPGSGDIARDYDTRVNGLSSHFVWTNRSKESLALDLKKNKDLTTLKVLLGRADVFVQNLAPGAAGRLGLSHDDLHTENARLIVCNISGYGMDGLYKDKKAYDLLIQSEAGRLSVTGTPDSPAKVGVSIADITAGMFAYNNILATPIQRNKTGKCQRIDISMLESMAEWMGFPMYYAYKNAPGPRPAGAAHAAIYPYGPFETGDGLTIMFGIQNEREWAAFCAKILAEKDLATDPRFCNNSLRVKNRDELQRLIFTSLASLTAPEAVSRLDEAGIANANVNDMRGLWGHPQLRARDSWAEVDTAVGRVPSLIPPGIPSYRIRGGMCEWTAC